MRDRNMDVHLIILVFFPFALYPVDSSSCDLMPILEPERRVSCGDADTYSVPRDVRCIVFGDAKHNCSLNVVNWSSCNSLERLIVNTSTEVPLAIFEKCPNLNRIDFEGADYSCKNKTWGEFITNAKRKKVTLCSSKSSKCQERELNISPKGNFLNQIVSQDIKENCPHHCMCKDHEVYVILVYCSQKSLNDTDLPDRLPIWSSQLYFDSNNLKDVEKWLDYVMRKYKFIERINLSSNRIESLPVVPETTSEILYLSFENNSITKFERPPFESYSKSKNLLVALKNNNWRCDCQMEEFVDFLMKKANIFVYQIDDIYKLYCKTENGHSVRPWMYDFTKCHKEKMVLRIFLYIVSNLDIVILSGANVALIVLLLNIQYVLRKNHSEDEDDRVPWMHYVAVVLEEYLLGHLRRAWHWIRNLLVQRLS